MKHRDIWALLGITGSFGLLLAPVSTGDGELARRLQDAMHGPLFAIVAIAAFAYVRDRWATLATWKIYSLSLLAALSLGGLGEVLQWAFSNRRQAEWHDLVTDGLGAGLGLCLRARFSRNWQFLHSINRRFLIAASSAMVCTLAAPALWSAAAYAKRQAQAPELATWRTSLGHHFLNAETARTEIQIAPTQWQIKTNEFALYIGPNKDHRWSGITIEEPLSDWSRYSALEITIINPNNRPLELILRIDDRSHNQEYADRFNGNLQFAAQQRTVLRLPLSAIEQSPATRLLRLNAISQLVLFQDTKRDAQSFYLCGIRLVK